MLIKRGCHYINTVTYIYLRITCCYRFDIITHAEFFLHFSNYTHLCTLFQYFHIFDPTETHNRDNDQRMNKIKLLYDQKSNNRYGWNTHTHTHATSQDDIRFAANYLHSYHHAANNGRIYWEKHLFK
jgi:hypothetical protein